MTPIPPAAWRSQRPVTLLVVALGIGAVLMDWVWMALPAAIALVSASIPAATRLRRVLVAVPVLVAAVATVLTTLAVVDVQTDLRWCVAAIVVAAGAIGLFQPPAAAPWADTVDAWSAASAAAVVVLADRTAFGWSPAQVIAHLAGHTDGVRHTSLGAAVNTYGGYVTFADHMDRLLPGLQHYPQGAAGLMAVTMRAFVGRNPGVGPTAVTGFWVLVAVLALTTWVMTTLAAVVAERVRNVPLRPAEFAAVSAVVVVTSTFGPSYLTHEIGYFAQEVATLALLTAMVVMVESGWSRRVAAILMLLLISVAQSWYLLVPVAVVGIAWWWRKQPDRGQLALPALLAAPFVVFPFVAGPSPTKQLLAVGITPAPRELVVASMIVGAGAALVALRAASAIAAGLLKTFLTVLTAFMLVVGITELVQASADSAYYAVKLFVLVLEFGGIVMAAGLAVAMFSRQGRDIVLASTVAVSTLAAGIGGFHYYSSHTAKPEDRAVREAQLYLDHAQDAQSALLLVYDGCGMGDRFLSHAIANLSGEFAPRLDDDFTKYMNSEGGKIDGLRQLLSRPNVHGVELITDRPCAPDRLQQMAELPGVTVIGS